MNMTVTWIDGHREPQCPSDPNYPKGVDLDVSAGAQRTCKTQLAYPAKRCGRYTIVCEICGLTVAVSTAGRADDPRSITLACRRSVTLRN